MAIPIVIADKHFKSATTIFNPNAFPAGVKADARGCADRLAILTHSVEIVLNEPGVDRSRLLQEIRSNKAFAGFVPDADKPAVLVLHNLNFISGLYSTLIALKSFLDLYSRLMARLLVPSASVFGFSNANFRDKSRSGGRFLKWVEGSVSQSFANRDKLVAILLLHIDDWIDQAVGYRDIVVHEGLIVGMTEAMLPFDRSLSDLRESDVVLPKMPNDVPVTDYCAGLIRLTRALVRETLPLLPDVDFNLISLEDEG